MIWINSLIYLVVKTNVDSKSILNLLKELLIITIDHGGKDMVSSLMVKLQLYALGMEIMIWLQNHMKRSVLCIRVKDGMNYWPMFCLIWLNVRRY